MEAISTENVDPVKLTDFIIANSTSYENDALFLTEKALSGLGPFKEKSITNEESVSNVEERIADVETTSNLIPQLQEAVVKDGAGELLKQVGLMPNEPKILDECVGAQKMLETVAKIVDEHDVKKSFQDVSALVSRQSADKIKERLELNYGLSVSMSVSRNAFENAMIQEIENYEKKEAENTSILKKNEVVIKNLCSVIAELTHRLNEDKSKTTSSKVLTKEPGNVRVAQGALGPAMMRCGPITAFNEIWIGTIGDFMQNLSVETTCINLQSLENIACDVISIIEDENKLATVKKMFEQFVQIQYPNGEWDTTSERERKMRLFVLFLRMSTSMGGITEVPLASCTPSTDTNEKNNILQENMMFPLGFLSNSIAMDHELSP